MIIEENSPAKPNKKSKSTRRLFNDPKKKFSSKMVQELIQDDNNILMSNIIKKFEHKHFDTKSSKQTRHSELKVKSRSDKTQKSNIE